MNNPIAYTAAMMTAIAIGPAHGAVPEVSGVSMAQDDNRTVTIAYTLSSAPAVVTLDVQTNVTGDVWASIGGEAVWNAMGDVWKRVETGSRTITWRPDHTWPGHMIADGGARAVVTAWALDNRITWSSTWQPRTPCAIIRESNSCRIPKSGGMARKAAR